MVGSGGKDGMQGRIQRLAEKELPDSQCGFRRGRSCSDMTFVVWQLSEKAIEHWSKQLIIFVYLKKAYDSVPREALWVVMEKMGVPEYLIDIVKSFHEGMEARVRVGEYLLDEIEVSKGLSQGCTMEPTLFNLYSCAVVEGWLERVKHIEGAGTLVFCKFDQKSFRRREQLRNC